jgi:hypothetical protein
MQEQQNFRIGYAQLAAGLFVFTVILQSEFELTWLRAILVSLSMFGGSFFIFGIRSAKIFMVEQLAGDTKLAPTTPEAFPTLDRTELDVLTTAYLALGFQSIGDYTLERATFERATKALAPCFMRMLWHKEHAVILEMSFYAPPHAAPLPLRSTMFSVYGDSLNISSELEASKVIGAPLPAPIPEVSAPRGGAQPASRVERLPWAYATTSREPSTMLQVIALPYNLGEHIPVETPPQEFLCRHLARRNEVAAALRLPVFGNMTLNFYQQWGNAQRALMWRKAQRLNLYIAIPLAFFVNKKSPLNAQQAIAAHRKAAKRLSRL